MYPYILVSLVLTLIFALGCQGAIRKHAGAFYTLAVLIVVAEVLYYQLGWRDAAPEWLTNHIVNPLSAARCPPPRLWSSCTWVRWTQSVPLCASSWVYAVSCPSSRAFVPLGHNIIYGKKHFVMLFTNPCDETPKEPQAWRRQSFRL